MLWEHPLKAHYTNFKTSLLKQTEDLGCIFTLQTFKMWRFWMSKVSRNQNRVKFWRAMAILLFVICIPKQGLQSCRIREQNEELTAMAH